MWQQEVLHRFTTLWIYTILKQCVLTIRNAIVSLPYGFTLFSNKVYDAYHALGFTTLWIYTILKQGQTLLLLDICFTTLWIYTILKRSHSVIGFLVCFTTLWIYTILKPFGAAFQVCNVSLPYGFTLFSNAYAHTAACCLFHYLMDLHYSQTKLHKKCAGAVSLPYGFTLFSNLPYCRRLQPKFHYLMDLLYSQTYKALATRRTAFHYLMDLHYSQTKRETKYRAVFVSLPYGFTLFSNL